MSKEFSLPKKITLKDLQKAIRKAELASFELTTLTNGRAEGQEFNLLICRERTEELSGPVELHSLPVGATEEDEEALVARLKGKKQVPISYADVWIAGKLVPVVAARVNGGSVSPTPVDTILRGDGSFQFVARIDGEDLVVENVSCTFFGGADDPMDNGSTASGLSTKDDPDIRGCALPMDKAGSPKTDGSPIPFLKYRDTQVLVKNRANARTIQVPLIVLGPSKHANSNAAIDLTKAAFSALGTRLEKGVMQVDYRILGGARDLLATTPGGGSLAGESRDLPEDDQADGDGHGSSNALPKPAVISMHRSPNRSSRDGAVINMIVLHCTEGTLQSAINTFLTPNGRQVSSHYVIDRNGKIYQMVSDAERAHHCKGANEHSIGIEHVGLDSQALAPEQATASAQLIGWLMTQYKVPAERVFGHDFAPGRLTSTSCPDHLFGPAHTQDIVAHWVEKNVVS